MAGWSVRFIAKVNRDMMFTDDEVDLMGKEFTETTTYGYEGSRDTFACDTHVEIGHPAIVPPDFPGGEALFAARIAAERITRALHRANGTRMLSVLSVEVEPEEVG